MERELKRRRPEIETEGEGEAAESLSDEDEDVFVGTCVGTGRSKEEEKEGEPPTTADLPSAYALMLRLLPMNLVLDTAGRRSYPVAIRTPEDKDRLWRLAHGEPTEREVCAQLSRFFASPAGRHLLRRPYIQALPTEVIERVLAYATPQARAAASLAARPFREAGVSLASHARALVAQLAPYIAAVMAASLCTVRRSPGFRAANLARDPRAAPVRAVWKVGRPSPGGRLAVDATSWRKKGYAVNVTLADDERFPRLDVWFPSASWLSPRRIGTVAQKNVRTLLQKALVEAVNAYGLAALIAFDRPADFRFPADLPLDALVASDFNARRPTTVVGLAELLQSMPELKDPIARYAASCTD